MNTRNRVNQCELRILCAHIPCSSVVSNREATGLYHLNAAGQTGSHTERQRGNNSVISLSKIEESNQWVGSLYNPDTRQASIYAFRKLNQHRSFRIMLQVCNRMQQVIQLPVKMQKISKFLCILSTKGRDSRSANSEVGDWSPRRRSRIINWMSGCTVTINHVPGFQLWPKKEITVRFTNKTLIKLDLLFWNVRTKFVMGKFSWILWLQISSFLVQSKLYSAYSFSVLQGELLHWIYLSVFAKIRKVPSRFQGKWFCENSLHMIQVSSGFRSKFGNPCSRTPMQQQR